MNPQSIDYQLRGARATFQPHVHRLNYSYRDPQSPSNNAARRRREPDAT